MAGTLDENNPTVSKEKLLCKLLEGVKGCQSRFGSRTELATEDDESVRKLCVAFEDVLLHGVKVPEKGTRSLWQMTENLVPAGLRPTLEPSSFWPLIKSQLSKHESERFLLLHNVRTDYGRGRCWLRAALNEHSLERYILTFLSLDNLPTFYEQWAFLRDPELSSILPQTAAGLGSVLFALVVDNPMLDCWIRPTVSKQDAVASPVEVAEVADQFLSALKDSDYSTRTFPSSSSTKDALSPVQTPTQRQGFNKKRKKKPHVNVVSFDDEGDAINEEKSVAQQSVSSSSTNTTPSATPAPILRENVDKMVAEPSSTYSGRSSGEFLSSAPVQISPFGSKNYMKEVDSYPEISVYSSSVKSVDCISVNSVYSDCSERMNLENVNVDLDFGLGRISPSQRLKPVSDRGSPRNRDGIDSDPHNENYNDVDSLSQDLNLIPIPNFNPGSESAPELNVPDLSISLDRNCVTSPSPITTPSCASECALNFSLAGVLTREPTGSINSSADTRSICESTRSKIDSPANTLLTSALGAEGNCDEKIIKLKLILDREIETVATLQAQLAEEKRKSTDQVKILEARIETLGKDNEILRHQLNKYIGAVQMLKREGHSSSRVPLVRRGSSFDPGDEEILNEVDRNVENTSLTGGESYTERDEGAEYERKLIQVAEMHGELMEFNTHLQSCLRKRDIIIRRMREELVDLRGPLAAPLLEDTGFDDSSWDIVDSGNSHESGGGIGIGSPTTRREIQITHNPRVLINIWVPSAFLTGATTDLHHVYQIFIRIRDTEWNVYRRYSQFYSLHRDMKKRDPVVGTFYFPPKKHLGNKDGKFVDERRRKLQNYLRKVINHILQTNSILAAHPDKNLLISIFPFFGENTFGQTQQKAKERSRGRKLFFLSSSHDSTPGSQNVPHVHNSSSGFQTQMQYPEYTGL